MNLLQLALKKVIYVKVQGYIYEGIYVLVESMLFEKRSRSHIFTNLIHTKLKQCFGFLAEIK